MIALISYDLNKPRKGYSDLHDAIKAISGTWWHHLTSVWLVDTDLSTQEIYEKVKEHIDENDELFITRITRDYTGYLPKKAWEWLKDRVSF